MKRIYTLLSILCAAGMVNAQVEIPASDFNPEIGTDSTTYVNLTRDFDASAASLSQSGTGVTWDFSAYTAQSGDTVYGKYIHPDDCGICLLSGNKYFDADVYAGLPNPPITAANEPSIGFKIDTTEFFFRESGNDIQFVGWVYATGYSSGNPTWAHSVMNDKLATLSPFMKFPLKESNPERTATGAELGASEIEPGYIGSGSSQAVTINMKADTKSEVFAEGSLKLPYGTLDNVVLVRWHADGSTDDNNGQGTYTDGDADVYIYQWYQQGDNATFPVAQAYVRTKTRTSANLNAFTWRNMYYRTGGVVASVDAEERAATEFNVFPNPATNKATITFDVATNMNVKAEVIDIVGQRVMTIVDEEVSAGKFSKTVDVSDLPKGNYMIKAELDGQVSVKKLIVQ
jgi:hypothetical protein